METMLLPVHHPAFRPIRSDHIRFVFPFSRPSIRDTGTARRLIARLDLYRRARLGLALTVSLALVILASAAQAQSLDILQPLAQSTEQAKVAAIGQSSGSAQVAPEVYVARTGGVLLNVDAFLPASPNSSQRSFSQDSFQGRAIGLTFFEGARFDVEVNAVTHPRRDTLAMRGRLAGQQIATFTLTVTPRSYLISLQDLENAKLYRVVGDTDTGTGQVRELDLSKMPPVFDSPPIVPPMQ